MITVENLTIDLGGIENLSFSIERGERVGLIGESGSGKTITALSLMGLLGNTGDPATHKAGVSGAIKFDGQDLLALNEKQWCEIRGAKIAMVFQEPMTALNPLMKAGKQVEEALRLHNFKGDIKARVKQLFSDVALDHKYLKSYPHQLSGGQRQRVLIAMALANDPDLLICDEPTTALDVTVQQEIVQLILRLVRERGSALLFITHDLGLVSQVCERILVLKEGKLVEQGPVQQVLAAPQSDYARGLKAASDLSARDHDGHLYTVSTAITGDYQQGVAHATPVFPPIGESVLTAADVSKKGRLHPIDVTLRAGERLGVVGGSGAGKTTLLKILAGLEKPSTGTVSVKEQLQVVFQDPFDSLDPRMTIGDSVAEPLRKLPAAERNQRVREVLDEVGIPADAHKRYPHEFSGGQRQRISIARALTVRPKILLADEPVSALDVSVRAQVMNLLTDLAIEYDLAMMFVSHDLGVVGQLCNRVMVLDQGTCVEQGTVEDVFANPQTEYTKTLLAAVPRIMV